LAGNAVPLVAAESADNTTKFNSQPIANLPNGGKDLTYLAQRAPGVVMNTGQGSGNFNANGLPATSNVFNVDGQKKQDPFLKNNNSGPTNLVLGKNSVAEAAPPSPIAAAGAAVATENSTSADARARAPLPPGTRSNTSPQAQRATVAVTGEAPLVNSESADNLRAPSSGITAESRPAQNTKNTPASAAALAGSVRKSPQKQSAKRAQTNWEISPDGKLLRGANNGALQPVDFPEHSEFFAVAAVGEEVWAAGEGGTLYHSVDDGITWRRQAFPSQQDLLSVEFSNHREGLVTDSQNALYATQDGGQSWHKTSGK
jgi:hypothetical protein